MKRLFIFFAALIAFAGLHAQQDPTNLIQEFTIKIDNLGDADYTLTQKMTQQQWTNFKQSQLANDPAIARRDLQRAMSATVIEDFKRDLDEMNRTATISMKVKAMAIYKGDGNWEVKLDSKDPQVTKLTDNSFMITSNAIFGNQLTQQIFKVFLPSGASSVQQSTDAFNKAIFTYKSNTVMATILQWNYIVGALLILGAIAAFVLSYKKDTKLSLSKIVIHAPQKTVE
jgi:hypothetical protein